MSIFDKASMVLLAAGAAGKGGDGNGTVYSIKPTNGDGDLSLNRGADLAATRVAKDGTIEKGRENLLVQSNQFDTTWVKHNSAVTSGQSGYDGSNDAWELKMSVAQANTTRSYIRQESLSVNQVSTFSVYVKAGNVNWVRLNALTSGTNINNYFDLSGSGAVGASPSATVIESTITSVGNGWFRISLASKGEQSITSVRIYIAEADGDEYPPTNSYIYIQNAQLERGIVPTGYINSGASTGKSGLIIDEPRFDYTGGGCPKLLLEPQRVNLAKASEYFNHLHWGDLKLSEVADNDLISPEGVKNAVRIQANQVNGTHAVYTHVIGVTSGTKYTLSIFAKKTSNNNRIILTLTKANGTDIGFDEPVFNLEDGTITGDSSNAEMIEHEDGWWRCIVTSSPNSSEDARLYTYICEPDGTKTYQPTDTSNEVYLYGAQWEANASASSYIPTHGSGSTRDADTITNIAIPEVNDDEYTFFVHDVNGLEENANRGPRLSDQTSGATNQSLMGYYVNNGSKNFFCYTDNGSGTKAFPNVSNTVVDAKYAFVIDNVNLRARGFLNGDLIGDGTPAVTTEPTHLTIASAAGDPNEIHQIMYFPMALSSTEVKILTGATNYVSFGAMTDALTNYTTYE